MMRTILKHAGMAVAFSGALLAAGTAIADTSGKAAYVARAEQIIVKSCGECGPNQDPKALAQNLVKGISGSIDVKSAEPFDLVLALLEGVPAHGAVPAVPSFAGRLNDAQIADLANYVRGALGVTGLPAVTAGMVATLRASRGVPDYGTQAASAFKCPVVGGEPGSYGAPDPKAVAAISAMMAGGERSVPLLVDTYRKDDPKATPPVVVDALAAAYCPVVAASDAPYYQRVGELRRFVLEAADEVFPRTLRGKVTDSPVIWAVPAGASLVMREPRTVDGPLACPAPGAGGVSAPLEGAAATLLGKPKLPVTGENAAKLAQKLAQDVPDARPAHVADALISAYCRQVAADKALEAPQQKEFMNLFGQQVIQTLQMEPARHAAASGK